MNLKPFFLLAALVLSAPHALAHEHMSHEPESTVAMAEPLFMATVSETATATIDAVNQETREVVLTTAAGEQITTTAGPEVRNLAQVKAGDTLLANVERTLVVAKLDDDGMPPEAADVLAIARAEEGEKPGIAMLETEVVTALIRKIDRENMTVDLEGPGGDISTVAVQNRDNLERVKEGDKVAFVIETRLVLAVENAE